MKTINSIAALFLIVFTISACGTSKLAFQNSPIVPAATGSVSVKKDKNKNYAVDIEVYNLAEPKRLTPPKNVYIVWMESTENPVKKLGQINTSSGTFSKALKANLKTTTLVEPTRIFITAEDNPDLDYPTGEAVLSARK